MLRAMVTFLFEHEKIKTTVAKAKELKSAAEKIITISKNNNLNAKRRALSYVTKESVVKKLFDEIAPRYEDRKGGCISLTRIGVRRGDASEMVIVKLV